MDASWNNFFAAGAGAGAALAGLIIAAMSVNVKTIIGIPGMTSRAATTIAVLTLMALVALAGLFPHQTPGGFGIVVVVCSAPVLGLALRSASVMVRDAVSPARLWAAAKGLLGVLPASMAAAAGIVLILGGHGGLMLLGASMLVSIAASVTNAWVLLVEILR